MGFNMKKTLLFGLSGLLFAGCVQIPNMDEDETPTTVEAVVESLSAGWGSTDPLSMKKGNFILNHTYRTIDNGEEKLVLEEGVTVFDQIERANDYLYKFLYQTRYKDNLGNEKINTTETQRVVNKSENILEDISEAHTLGMHPLLNFSKKKDLSAYAEDYRMTLGFENLVGLAYACELSEDQQKYCREQLKYDSCEVKCFNLKKTSAVVDKPPYMKQITPCSDPLNCKTTYETVSFDWAVYYKKGANTEKQKVNYSITMNQELPFLARVTSYCYRTLVAVESQMVPVRFCNRQENYIETQTNSAF